VRRVNTLFGLAAAKRVSASSRGLAIRLKSSDASLFLHGSTIAINTLLERNGANTALLEGSATWRRSGVLGGPNPT
jgi:N-methylhydantoinase A/oxoprolinase/acetone carboxylase beta subunit